MPTWVVDEGEGWTFTVNTAEPRTGRRRKPAPRRLAGGEQLYDCYVRQAYPDYAPHRDPPEWWTTVELGTAHADLKANGFESSRLAALLAGIMWRRAAGWRPYASFFPATGGVAMKLGEVGAPRRFDRETTLAIKKARRQPRRYVHVPGELYRRLTADDTLEVRPPANAKTSASGAAGGGTLHFYAGLLNGVEVVLNGKALPEGTILVDLDRLILAVLPKLAKMQPGALGRCGNLNDPGQLAEAIRSLAEPLGMLSAALPLVRAVEAAEPAPPDPAQERVATAGRGAAPTHVDVAPAEIDQPGAKNGARRGPGRGT